MEHREYIRLVPGADTAVLLIHGIVGTPRHFRDILPLEAAVPEVWSVHNILLPGHGGSMGDFAHSSMKAWKDKVWQAFEHLAASHEKIVLVGHSMGTLFSMQLALEHPDKVPFLFLIAAPMRPGVRLFGLGNMLRLAFGRIREDHPMEVATRNVCGVTTTPLLWNYIPWIPRFLELFREIYITEKRMGGLTTPCVSYQSRRDELVMGGAVRVLVKSGVVDVHVLENSSHFYYAPEDQEILLSAFYDMIKKTGIG